MKFIMPILISLFASSSILSQKHEGTVKENPLRKTEKAFLFQTNENQQAGKNQYFGKNHATYTVQENVKVSPAKKGTYRIDYASENIQKIMLSKDILLSISSARKQSEDVSLEIKDGVSVFIPSRDAMSNPTFTILK